MVAVVSGIAVWSRISGPGFLSEGIEFGSEGAITSTLAQGHLAAARSEALEEWIASLPREPAVVRVGTRAAVAGLEDRIAQVDDLLTDVRLQGSLPDRVAALQQERVRLLGSLAQVRYAEAMADGAL